MSILLTKVAPVALVKPLQALVRRQPRSVNLVAGRPLKLAVEAIGVGLAYQWQRHDTLKGWVSIVGQRGSTYDIPEAVVEDAGSYRVSIKNAGGATLSAAANVTVEALKVSVEPVKTVRTPKKRKKPIAVVAAPLVVIERVDEPEPPAEQEGA